MAGTVGDRIRTVINDMGLSMSAFARLAGIKDSSLRDFANDTNKPGMEALVRISEAAQVMLDWLVLGTGPMMRTDALTVDWMNLLEEDVLTLKDEEKIEFAKALRSLCRLPEGMREGVLKEFGQRIDERAELEELRAGQLRRKPDRSAGVKAPKGKKKKG